MPITTLLFDAGNTLILEQPDPRPMADWPSIEAVPGVRAALEALHPSYRLVVASNADVSTGQMARRALARLGLDAFFTHVFTSVDLKLSKPDPRYFQAVLKRAGASPQDACMVGDLYDWDVLGARAAGLKAIWYNPGNRKAPGGVPEQDGEVSRMQDLPALLSSPLLPDIPTCETWLAAEGAGESLKAHVRAVAFTAYHLAWRIRQAGSPVDPLLAHRGGLLHDLDKITYKAQGLHHGEYAAQLLEKRGFPALGSIARRHVGGLVEGVPLPETLEEKIVHLSDKLVEGCRFAGLQERMAGLQERYPAFAARLAANMPRVQRLKDDLCRLAGLAPRELDAELIEIWPG